MEQPNSYLKWKVKITALVCLLLSNAVCADIYLFVDKNGNKHVDERQFTPEYRLILTSDSNTTSNFRNTRRLKNMLIR